MIITLLVCGIRYERSAAELARQDHPELTGLPAENRLSEAERGAVKKDGETMQSIPGDRLPGNTKPHDT